MAPPVALTVRIGPAKPPEKRLSARMRPAVRASLLAPTSAIAFGANRASKLRMLRAGPPPGARSAHSG